MRRSAPVVLTAIVAIVAGVSSLGAAGTTTAAPANGNAAHSMAAALDPDFLSPNARREAAFESADRNSKLHPLNPEANRGGPLDPATEQVDNRAYPRSYVDDRLAVKDRKAYRATASTSSRRSFHSAAAYRSAAKFAPGAWKAQGPVTPNVSSYASQFFDPKTDSGPTTQESGRETAIAVDPNCGKNSAPSGAPCRLWIAAAGGGVWRTDNALADHPTWTAPPADLPSNAFGSLIIDPTDATGNTLYAGTGEPNGSSDSEAGVGLFKTTDGGATWNLVPGSAAPGTNRSIGAIAVDPTNSQRIYIGTDVARHGSSSVNGGRRTPPDAPDLGVYVSSDGGQTFSHETDLSTKAPQNPTPSSTGADWFQGGINKLEIDPNNSNRLYAAVQGYGVWRADQSGNTPGSSTWTQVFHTVNQTDFSNDDNPGDTFGDRTEFDLVKVGSQTRAYLGDASDDFASDGDDTTPLPQVWRNDDVATVSGSTTGALDNDTAGWKQLSDATNGSNGYGAYGWCQNGQCGYDAFVASPGGQLGVADTSANQDALWLGGSMNYDELPAYQGTDTSLGTRSNGRGVIRSINAGATDPGDVAWKDMTATLGAQTAQEQYPFTQGLHPDEHGIQFDPANPNIAFEVSDGGIYRVDVTAPVDASSQCAARTFPDSTLATKSLTGADLVDCTKWLNGIPNKIDPLNDGLNDLQFQSVSADVHSPYTTLLGGTQDNGTWQFTGGASSTGLEVVGGDGGQSGFDAANAHVRYHNYYSSTPEVNFADGDPTVWYDIYDPLLISGETSSFYTPFVADPLVGGRAFDGLQHVWRTDDNGGTASALAANGCNAANLDPNREAPCGDWQPLGQDLTSPVFGDRDGAYVVAVTRAPSNTGTVWAATRSGRLFVSTDADGDPAYVQFRRIDTDSTPGRFVSGIAVDPDNPNVAYVSYSGYNAYTPDTPGHVFKAVYSPAKHTATFTDLSYSLGDQPITSVVEDPATQDLYAGTDFGVLRLPSGTKTWVKAGRDLPSAAVYGLTLSTGGHRLLAATHGRGVWSVGLARRPSPSITGPSRIQLGKKATYTGHSTNPNAGTLSYSWTLPGKPAHASGKTVTFTPTKLGTKTITLTVTDSLGIKGTVSRTVKVVDTVGPSVSLAKPKSVKLGALSTIKGRASDPGGVASVEVKFGDGTFVNVSLKKGAFSVTHRYPHRGSFTVTAIAVDKSGNHGSAKTKAKVT